MKKGIVGGWRVVHPIKNEDGSINWPNLLFGGWSNFWFIVFATLIISAMMYAYKHDVKAIEDNYRKIADDPFKFCKDIKCGNGSYTDYQKTSQDLTHLLNQYANAS